jgi:hypothetical protein
MTASLQLARIRIDGGTQARATINQPAVDDYAAAIRNRVVFPPIVVFFDGTDYWLADGFHRYHAARAAGRRSFPVEVRQGTRREAVLHSVGSNDTHGLRRTNEDKRRAVTTLLSDAEWSRWSDRAIAKRCAVSHEFVRQIRALTVNVDSERRYTTRHGVDAEMDTSRIGASADDRNRANLRAAVGTASATKAERGDNFYRTPREAVLTLLALERFHNRIWEPACGDGAISKILEAAGHDVLITDLVDRGCSKADGELQGVADFLKTVRNGKEDGDFSIVTNPPYGDALNRFVAHALREHRPKKMAMLLNLNALCGFNDPDRNFWMDDWPPARIIVFTRRLPMMHRDDWDGNEASSRMNTAWFVWERVAAYRGVDQARRPYGGQTIVRRTDWKDYVKWEPEEGWRDGA